MPETDWAADLALPCQCGETSGCRFLVAAARDKVARILQEISQPDLNDIGNRFVPRGRLVHYFDKKAVIDLLRSIFNGDIVTALASFITHDETTCPVCNNSIREFYNYSRDRGGVCDSSYKPHSAALKKKSNDDFSKITDAWESWEKELFRHWQWRMRSPYLKKLIGEDKPQKLEGEVTLPWTEIKPPPESESEFSESECPSESGQYPRQGQHSKVWRIKIHADHHEVGSKEDYFALKGTDNHEDFKAEFDAHQNLGQVPSQITPLLAAFEQNDIRYLLFPWAEGGSLEQIWETTCPFTSHWCSATWLWEQCVGLSSGLAYIHGQGTAAVGHGAATAQLHADIKPENILFFGSPQNGQGPYALKFADFGLACNSLSEDGRLPIRYIENTMSYRPPEIDLEELEASLQWDVWGLGCVFLEFVTWFLRYYEGLTSFRIARREERDHRRALGFQGVVKEETFFHVTLANRWLSLLPGVKLVRDASVKKSVVLEIQLLKGKAADSNHQNLQRLLDCIRNNMLVIEESRRLSASDVNNFLLTSI
ncbi:kinase-like protein [Thozetella sp. PMI_491]|nr:kinase-like protein [Thozetella sp. PMI_491]